MFKNVRESDCYAAPFVKAFGRVGTGITAKSQLHLNMTYNDLNLGLTQNARLGSLFGSIFPIHGSRTGAFAPDD